MQLDFFKKLVPWFAATPPPPDSPSPPADKSRLRASRKPKVEPEEIWQETARTLLRNVGCEDLANRVIVRWNFRMRSTAGTALPSQALVNLNPRLREFGESEIDRTLRHELAHLLAHHRAGRRRIAPHGDQWRRACRDLGLVDEQRCHTLPLPRREMARPYVYCCPRCSVRIRRVRQLRRKIACLDCCRKFSGGKYDDRFRFVKSSQ